MTSKQIAKALKENKVYSELGLLYELGCVQADKYPNQYKITLKGNKY